APGGNIRLQAGSIQLVGLSADASEPLSVSATGAGNAGDVLIDTGDLSILRGASISAIANSTGNGGDIVVHASRTILIDGAGRSFLAGIAAETQPDIPDAGNSGDITLNAPRILIKNNGEVTSTTKGAGAAGDIHVSASQSLTIDGGNLPDLTGLQARVG